jgi:hypothetical protein
VTDSKKKKKKKKLTLAKIKIKRKKNTEPMPSLAFRDPFVKPLVAGDHPNQDHPG